MSLTKARLEESATTCMTCGGRMTTRRENVKYEALGVPATLRNVEVSRCAKCGEYEVAIPRIENLHRAVAQFLVCKKSRLVPREIRFLRKYLGWSGADFARHMGTQPETVSRWETGAIPIGTQADRLLRLLVVCLKPVEDYSPDSLTKIASERRPQAVRVALQLRGQAWQVAAA